MAELGILLFNVDSIGATKYLQFRAIRASRRAAVGLAGVAPHLVPSLGHAGLIPDASGLLYVPSLRATLVIQGIGFQPIPAARCLAPLTVTE